jgi:hypothetical protein
MIEVGHGMAIREDGPREGFLRASGAGGRNVGAFCAIPERLGLSFRAAPALLR